MYKLLLFLLLAAFLSVLYALQTDQELAMHTLFQAKHAANRAAHAAAQQKDADKLAAGIPVLDPVEAESAALRYLQWNLALDAGNKPLPGTFLKQAVEVKVFDLIDENRTFPFDYFNSEYQYSVRFRKPGVVLVVRVVYPRVFSIIGPIVWDIKSASELVY